MAVDKTHGLLVYVDVSPSEQLDLKNNKMISMAGVVVDEDDGLPGLKQFKNGTWPKKMDHAANIVESIEKEEISIFAAGFTASEETLLSLVSDVFNVAHKELGGKWSEDTESYRWNDFDYPRSLLLGLCAYSVMLSAIGIKVSDWLGKMNIDRSTFLLDKLPTDPEKSMKMLEALTKFSDVRNNWLENEKRADGKNYRFANLGKYRDKNGKIRGGKSHPHFAIADWLAVSMRAKAMPQSFIDGDRKPRPPEDVRTIASIWDKLLSSNRAFHINLDDPDTARKLQSHLESLKTPNTLLSD